MNSLLQIASFAGTLALLAGSASGRTGRAFGPEERLLIRVYDEAQVPAAVLHSATMETARLFGAAGIRISWEHLSAELPEDIGTDMTAVAFVKPDERPYLVIRLRRQTPANLFPRALAYSLPFAHRGAHVQIFYDRVEALIHSVNIADYVVLGHVMAHELGHVLLGSTEHASAGLMQANWTPAGWRLASEGLVVFHRDEIKQLRAGMSRFQVVERAPAPFGQQTVAAAGTLPL
jgi:hypothetical protein